MNPNEDVGPSEAAPPAVNGAAAAFRREAVFLASAEMARSPSGGVVGTRFRQQVARGLFFATGPAGGFVGWG